MAGRTKWHRPVEYQGGFKALSQKGTIKITSYHEDISSSRQSQNQGRRTPGPIREGDDNKTE